MMMGRQVDGWTDGRGDGRAPGGKQASTCTPPHGAQPVRPHQVVEGDGVDGAEVVKVVLVGGVVPVPGHHVEGGAAGEGGLEEPAGELVDLFLFFGWLRWSWDIKR